MQVDIDALPAGQKLNALIAEHIFGWRWYPNGDGMRFFRSPNVFSYGGYWSERDAEPTYMSDLPAYSIDIAAAMQVVEWLRTREQGEAEPDFWRLIDCGKEGWRVEVLWDHHDGEIPSASACAETLPLAICRAILKLVRHDR
jgi:hypothetical protein